MNQDKNKKIFFKKNAFGKNFFERLSTGEFVDFYGPIIVSVFVLAYLYAHFLANHELKDYSLKEKLPAAQYEVVVHDPAVAHLIKREKEFSADFNRMYNELKGREKRNWRNQPLDSANIYPIMKYPCRELQPTMHEYYRYILEYRNNLRCEANQLAITKYKNSKTKTR